MKSYKISQTIEKNLYPIEAKMDEIVESGRRQFNQFLDIYAPVFLSALLTVAFGEKLLPNDANITSDPHGFWEEVLYSWWGKSVCILITFIVFALIIFTVFKIFRAIESRRDNKGTPVKRNRIANEFYKVILPEIITGASLFERAYEIEQANSSSDEEESTGKSAEDIILLESSDVSVPSKATLYYYESFYHFKLVKYGLEKNQIVEYMESDRDNLEALYALIGLDALKGAIMLSQHCVTQLCKRTSDEDSSSLHETFDRYYRDLNSTTENK